MDGLDNLKDSRVGEYFSNKNLTGKARATVAQQEMAEKQQQWAALDSKKREAAKAKSEARVAKTETQKPLSMKEAAEKFQDEIKSLEEQGITLEVNLTGKRPSVTIHTATEHRAMFPTSVKAKRNETPENLYKRVFETAEEKIKTRKHFDKADVVREKGPNAFERFDNWVNNL